MSTEALRMVGITKVYPNGVVANNDVNFSVNKGEIHALSGENGAGKSTLMKMLFGEEQPSKGDIYINGEKIVLKNSNTAIKLGIGMVHQHFMLLPSLTVLENMILGAEEKKGFVLDMGKAAKLVKGLSEKYNLIVPLDEKVRDLSVGQKQKVEILKALLHGAKILILDEPTAVLTPQETAELFHELKKLREDGYTIIFISHRLDEVKELCDRITILRHGHTIGVYNIADVSEEDISRLMVGRDVMLQIDKKKANLGDPIIFVRNLIVNNELGQRMINGVSFEGHRGEILGVAGVEGNGQSELIDVLSGNSEYLGGSIEVMGKDIKKMSIHELRQLKVSYIPEDRMTVGSVGRMSIAENLIADKSDSPIFTRKLGAIKRDAIQQFGKRMIERFQILCKGPDTTVESLSGGNIQKVVLARELSSDPDILLADQPTRGVDVGAAEFIRRELVRLRDENHFILLVSSDLNELLGLSDRLIVLYRGRISAFFSDTSMVTEESLGRFMLGVETMNDEEIRRTEML